MNMLLALLIGMIAMAIIIILTPDQIRRVLIGLVIAFMIGLSILVLQGYSVNETILWASDYQVLSGQTLFSFEESNLSSIAAFGFIFVGALALLFGLELADRYEQAMSLLAIASAIGVAYANNFFTFLFFWELLTVTTCVLIMLKRAADSINIGFNILILQLIGGFSITLGIVLHYSVTGSLDLAFPQAGLPFFVFGIGLKTAFLPLHFWVPWGYPKANFYSSVLLAALCTKVGVYGVARILGSAEWIAVMGACMSIVAVTFALLQHDLRKLLSYHIISQVGYMIAGVGIGTAIAVDGAMLHLVNHMIYKALLFMSAGMLIYSVNTDDIHDLRTHDHNDNDSPFIWKMIPVAFIGALVGALSISGFPPFNGYVSKYLLKHAAHDAGIVETLLLVASVGTAISFAKFVYFAFIKGKAKLVKKPTLTMQAAVILASFSCLLFGVAPQLIAKILPYGSSLHVYSFSGIRASLQLIFIGVIIFVVTARLLEKSLPEMHWFKELTKQGVLIGKLPTVIFNYIAAWMQSLTQFISLFITKGFRTSFKFLQSVDYKPGSSAVFRSVNIGNIDFSLFLVIFIFVAVIVFLFFLQFHSIILSI